MPAKICKAVATLRSSMSASRSEHHTDNNDMQPTENGNTNFAFRLSEQQPLVVRLPPHDTLHSDQTTLPSGQRSRPRPTCAVKPFQAAAATVPLSVEGKIYRFTLLLDRHEWRSCLVENTSSVT